MNKYFCMLSAFLIPLFLYVGVAFAEVPQIENIIIEASVIFDEQTMIYEYNYFVSNPSSNTGEIDRILVDISRDPGALEIKSDGLTIYKGLNWKGEMRKIDYSAEFSRKGDLLVVPIIPIGGAPPSGWGFNFSTGGKAHWGAMNRDVQIKPNTSLGGFVLRSRGIPSIRKTVIEPDWIYVTDGYISEEDSKRARKIEDQIAFKTKTIGPTAPPKVLVPVEFVNNIIKMKHEAAELGWITNAGIVRSLDQKLDSIKKKLQQNNKGAAKNILGAFINEVEAQGCESYADCPRGKHLKPEAYALLKYNARYLIDNLK